MRHALPWHCSKTCHGVAPWIAMACHSTIVDFNRTTYRGIPSRNIKRAMVVHGSNSTMVVHGNPWSSMAIPRATMAIPYPCSPMVLPRATMACSPRRGHGASVACPREHVTDNHGMPWQVPMTIAMASHDPWPIQSPWKLPCNTMGCHGSCHGVP